MEEEKEGIGKRLENIEELLKTKKDKKFRLPMKAKVGKSKLKKGFITVVTLNENKEVSFVKKPIIDGTYALDEGYITIHATESKDILTYKGKPLVIQAKTKLNPYNPYEGEHETYGQKYVIARMEGDKIHVKKSLGTIGWIVGAIILAVFGYSIITGGI